LHHLAGPETENLTSMVFANDKLHSYQPFISSSTTSCTTRSELITVQPSAFCFGIFQWKTISGSYFRIYLINLSFVVICLFLANIKKGIMWNVYCLKIYKRLFSNYLIIFKSLSTGLSDSQIHKMFFKFKTFNISL
jgi:hypothetical protein